MIQSLRHVGVAAGLLAANLAFAQQDPSAPAPDTLQQDELPTVPVDEASEPIPGLPRLEWAVASNVQLDALADSDLPENREKSSELRRARVSALLEWDFDWILKAGGDFADGAELRELSIEYRGWPVHLEAGRIVEPFGALQGGSRNAPLMERPQAYGLATGYGLGLAANARGDRWGFTAGIFKATQNDPLEEGGREENAFTLRGTFAPLKAEDKVLHLGFAGSYREAGEGTLQFVAIPESVLLRGLNASSSLFFADGESNNRYYLYGVEFASQFGPVTLKSEYMQAHLDEALALDESNNTFDTGDPVFFGYYFESAWAVTGERRDYSVRRGVLGGITPDATLANGGIGAVELAARFSFVHLMDDQLGGEEGAVLSGGVNWYPLDEVKVMLEALQVEEMRIGSSESAFAIQARVQANFGFP